MKIRTKAEIIGRFHIKEPISFNVKDVTITLSTQNDKNYVDATKKVTDYMQFINCGVVDDVFQYADNHEKALLESLKLLESIGSFHLHIQEIRYDERKTDWVAETAEEKEIIDKLPKASWEHDKTYSVVEISQKDLDNVTSISSTITDDIYAFELLRQGNVSLWNHNFYFAFVNYFMILEEAFGEGKFKTDKLKAYFSKSNILYLCVLSALESFNKDPLYSLCVEWVQNEISSRDKDWNYKEIIDFIIDFRGSYFHSHKRIRVLQERDEYFKYIAYFTQRICIMYCYYLDKSYKMGSDELKIFVKEEIAALKELLDR